MQIDTQNPLDKFFTKYRVLSYLLVFILMSLIGGLIMWIFILPSRPFSCEELFSSEEVANIFSEHSDTKEKIEAIKPGFIFFSIYPVERCPGKSEVYLYYGVEQDRVKIRKIMGETFWGIPVRMENV